MNSSSLRLWNAGFGDSVEKDLTVRKGDHLRQCITKGAFENCFMITFTNTVFLPENQDQRTVYQTKDYKVRKSTALLTPNNIFK